MSFENVIAVMTGISLGLSIGFTVITIELYKIISRNRGYTNLKN